MSDTAVAYQLQTRKSVGTIDSAIFLFFGAEILIITALQKISIPQSPLPLTTALLPAGVAILFLLGRARIDLTSVSIYAITALFAIAGQLFTDQFISIRSLALFVVLYFPFIFRIAISQETYRRCMKFYINVMLVFAAIVIAEDLWQFLVQSGHLPNLEHLIPQSLQVPGYVYIQPLRYGSPYIKPNGIAFLEVSFLSQFLAIALMAELVFFERLTRIAMLTAGIFATFGGTGLLALLIVSPLVAARLKPKILVLGAIVLAVAAPLLIASGWYAYGSGRLAEFGAQNTSAYHRFVEPLVEISRASLSPSSIYTGIGAGNLPKGPNITWWALTKVFSEFGLLTTASLYLLLIYCVFVRAPSLRLAAIIFVIYNFMGGNLEMPVIVNMMLLLGVLLRPTDDETGHGLSGAASPVARHPVIGPSPPAPATPG